MIFKKKKIALVHLPDSYSPDMKGHLENYYEKKLGKMYTVIVSFEKGVWVTQIEII